ncbi:MAG TPA: SDR family oxidoreductase [Thermoanaerobaculia bacterium]|nr:SDR family oxidoreductase [Thermoanaerobaculia bacterium]
MDLGLNNRVAMVAAASKGIGRAIAEALAAEGCRVSISSRSTDNLDEARHAIEAMEREVLAMSCDVSSGPDLERWVEATLATFGQIDVLVTNTGGPPAANFMNLSEEQWRQGIDSTLMNVVRLCKAVIPDMQKRRWGRIVHITSLVAKQPLELLTISSTLRAGLSGLTKTLADQVARDGITVNALLPGHIMTDRQRHLNEIRAREQGIAVEEYAQKVQQSIPVGRFGRPQEIADAVTFLCSDRASYITGVSLQVDGGIIRSTF